MFLMNTVGTRRLSISVRRGLSGGWCTRPASARHQTQLAEDGGDVVVVGAAADLLPVQLKDRDGAHPERLALSAGDESLVGGAEPILRRRPCVGAERGLQFHLQAA